MRDSLLLSGASRKSGIQPKLVSFFPPCLISVLSSSAFLPKPESVQLAGLGRSPLPVPVHARPRPCAYMFVVSDIGLPKQ